MPSSPRQILEHFRFLNLNSSAQASPPECIPKHDSEQPLYQQDRIQSSELQPTPAQTAQIHFKPFHPQHQINFSHTNQSSEAAQTFIQPDQLQPHKPESNTNQSSIKQSLQQPKHYQTKTTKTEQKTIAKSSKTLPMQQPQPYQCINKIPNQLYLYISQHYPSQNPATPSINLCIATT
ncbi:hypothetical protein LOK49_LG09G00884 [Camellia lanceoleosa]|uniref:Uncharacterized protein n=1 Tax=Camellia lanceoleosa TaxID=1840588 RepID=A0ACC0GFJ9_9ERIC|nr:hypothetical protein LOK49_LG09G00884 [Camellia lanceoleosa]